MGVLGKSKQWKLHRERSVLPSGGSGQTAEMGRAVGAQSCILVCLAVAQEGTALVGVDIGVMPWLNIVISELRQKN